MTQLTHKYTQVTVHTHKRCREQTELIQPAPDTAAERAMQTNRHGQAAGQQNHVESKRALPARPTPSAIACPIDLTPIDHLRKRRGTRDGEREARSPRQGIDQRVRAAGRAWARWDGAHR